VAEVVPEPVRPGIYPGLPTRRAIIWWIPFAVISRRLFTPSHNCGRHVYACLERTRM